MDDVTCAVDGCQEEPRKRSGVRGPAPRYCGEHDRHWRRVQPKVQRSCSVCGADITDRRRDAVFCGGFCSEIASGRRVRLTPIPERKCELDECDVILPAGWFTKRFCCEKHEKKAWYRAQRASGRSFYQWTDASRARYHARRARKAGASVGEAFKPREIFERDGWVCYLCEEPVDPELGYPDPMSASLEHVIPLVLGGTHSQDNVRCSHLRCNLSKGAAAAPGAAPAPPVAKRPRVPRQRKPRVKPVTPTLSPNLARIFAEAMALKASREGAMPSG